MLVRVEITDGDATEFVRVLRTGGFLHDVFTDVRNADPRYARYLFVDLLSRGFWGANDPRPFCARARIEMPAKSTLATAAALISGVNRN